ncbi:MAG TPA: glutamate--tRNA ligase [Chitinophagaceae bacterium]|nr:glutamate--tRNA ligase [Chitinophagaceae bacterium]
MTHRIRVRFAPSPTGGLHLGGVRTALFNYLFARHQGGDFVLRIEDTDASRYVPGAEEYILDCLKWCGISPDEGPGLGGEYGPYRQSERKSLYREYARQLVRDGHAYYAFDTPQELEKIREDLKRKGAVSPQYSMENRELMRNSFSLPAAEVQELLDKGTPHVIRIRMPQNEELSLKDLIRGEIHFDPSLVDDKVLLKTDGMPTYHLAVVVDDYLMKISHVLRGEEWLPSAPVHILLWKYLGLEKHMPEFAHLPLILRPDGNGKLSKRDGGRLGFPVNAMNWTDPVTQEFTQGFRETGFLPEAFVNMLAMLGWNSGTEQELFSLQELEDRFTIDRVHKGGAKFDYDKAKWFNHEWIKRQSPIALSPLVSQVFGQKNLHVPDLRRLEQVIALISDRCQVLDDFYDQGRFFFEAPEHWDTEGIKPKWNAEKKDFFESLAVQFSGLASWNAIQAEETFKALATQRQIKAGELLLPLRIMLVGGKFGPPVFVIAAFIGCSQTIDRINKALPAFSGA